MLSMVLKEELGLDKVRCVVFAAPPCMDPELSARAGEAYDLKNIGGSGVACQGWYITDGPLPDSPNSGC